MLRQDEHTPRQNWHLSQELSERLRVCGQSAGEVQASMAKLAVFLKGEPTHNVKTSCALNLADRIYDASCPGGLDE